MKLLVAGALSAALGTAVSAAPPRPAEVVVHLESATETSVSIVVDIDLADGWKTYYKSAEGYETEMRLHWTGDTAEAVAGYEILWPEHEVFDFYGEPVRGYRQDVEFPIEITLKEGAEIDTFTFNLEAYFCSNLCVREEIPYEIDITTHDLRLPWAAPTDHSSS